MSAVAAPVEVGPAALATRRPMIGTLVAVLRLRRVQVGLCMLGALVVLLVAGPLVAKHSSTEIIGAPFKGSTSTAWFGTDYLGRDVFSRVVHGGVSVIVLSFLATFVGVVIGVTCGLISGYARRWLDETIMRGLDVVLAFPSIVLVLLFVSIIGPKLWLIVVLVGLAHAPRIARVTRGATLEIVHLDYVQSAEATGVSSSRILGQEVLPNIVSPLLVEFGLRWTYSIGIIAGLSFLGFGMQPPQADWGLMINENRIGIAIQPLAVGIPVLLIAILTVGINLIADGFDRVLIGIDRDTGEQ